MDSVLVEINRALSSEEARAVIKAIVILLAGLLFAWLLRSRLARGRFNEGHIALLRPLISYIVIGVTVLWALRELGLNMSVLLGAAGILTVALGFASQTSASNIISGFFLMAERPFSIGDYITVDQNTGEVLSIDLLSVKIRTYSNQLVRIPNETMLKSNVTNITRFPIRRLDMKLGVAYKEDIERVREICYEVAHKNPMCLEEPAPFFIYKGFGESALEFQFSPWTTRENFWEFTTQMHIEIKRAFDEAGIEIPFPHRTLYTGSVTEPFPVQVMSADKIDTNSAQD